VTSLLVMVTVPARGTVSQHPQLPMTVKENIWDKDCLGEGCVCEPSRLPLTFVFQKMAQNIEEPNDSPALGPDSHKYLVPRVAREPRM